MSTHANDVHNQKGWARKTKNKDSKAEVAISTSKVYLCKTVIRETRMGEINNGEGN